MIADPPERILGKMLLFFLSMAVFYLFIIVIFCKKMMQRTWSGAGTEPPGKGRGLFVRRRGD